ncbi:GATA zinc finger domain-containing protein 10-like [Trichogramma pretiosum]|uniref:GATA zinc finger domain-containing protein 10-like n=1 Tax=Trichogramma pretiosum TaxID=7493 RepID=UPI0006C9BA7C|nr:GATA zinc finger domain-containing protein 10-like [Trichogramma pretiosum]
MDCCNYMPYQRQQHYYSHQHHHHHHHPAAAAQPYPTYQRNQQQALQHQYPQQQQQQQQLQQHQFNQQQQQQLQRTQQYCYEAAAYSPYDPTMSSSATSAELCAPRYASPAAPYATDYVYNPKEARLRKAMRDQTRSTTTAATTTAAATANNNNNNSPSSLGGSLLEQQQQQQQQRMQTSSLMVHNNGNGSSSGAAINRSGPWFPAAAAAASSQPSSKSAYSPKHRTSTLDAKSKDGTRKQQQQQDCSNQGCYPGQAYAVDYHPVTLDASSSAAHQAATPPADYCSYNPGNLSSKWYPYQNGASNNNNNNAYHSRNTLMSKINGYQQQQLRAAQQQQQGAHAMRPLAHSAWGQFCNMPYQPNQSVLARANRHMFYLQEQYHQHHQQQQHQYQHQQQQQHRQLDYADGAAQMQSAFEAKMQDELARRLHATPPQADSQSKNPLAQLQLSCSGIGDSSPKYCSSITGGGSSSSLIEEAPRWSTPRPSSVSSSSCTTDTLFEREEAPLLPRQPARCSKPLPGFQQAFGSTEIGKFSRSELFASLIEAAAAATSTVSTISSQGDYGSSSSPEMDDSSTSSASQQQQLHQGSAGWHAAAASPYAVGGEI